MGQVEFARLERHQSSNAHKPTNDDAQQIVPQRQTFIFILEKQPYDTTHQQPPSFTQETEETTSEPEGRSTPRVNNDRWLWVTIHFPFELPHSV